MTEEQDPPSSASEAQPAAAPDQSSSSSSSASASSASMTAPPPPTPKVLTSGGSSKLRRRSLPFSFPPLFFGPAANVSSTSLAPSTAEGKPIPLDNNVTAHRTSALRQLNSIFPSPVNRHRYGKSTGAQSTTYSQPVIVRTYSGPSPAYDPYSRRPYRPSSSNRGGLKRVPLPASSRSTSRLAGLPLNPVTSGLGSDGEAGNGNGNRNRNGNGNGNGLDMLGNESLPAMRRYKSKKSRLPLLLPWQWATGASSSELDDAKLPPLEAFSFKSIMADLQARADDNDIGADLDRIAEICARSRYSLSNQYEVHMSPHGSGTGFVTGTGTSRNSPGHRRKGPYRGNSTGRGPTLQAVSDDDGNPAKFHRKRRSDGRRRSIAYGTLETIMSSSRSSEEDRTKKKPAAEIAEEVRGRASRKNTSNSASSPSGTESTENGTSESHAPAAKEGTSSNTESSQSRSDRNRAASCATTLMEGLHTGQGLAKTLQGLSSFPISHCAPPQTSTSTSHLEIRTAPENVVFVNDTQTRQLSSAQVSGRMERSSREIPHRTKDPSRSHNRRLLSGLSSWIHRPLAQSGENTPTSSRNKSAEAEGSLRQLLRNADPIGATTGQIDDHGS